MNSSLISQGFDLMLFGMGTVFVFLTLLIFTTSAMSAIITKWFPEKAIAAPTPKKKVAATTGAAVAPATLKIIQAAVEKHRSR